MLGCFLHYLFQGAFLALALKFAKRRLRACLLEEIPFLVENGEEGDRAIGFTLLESLIYFFRRCARRFRKNRCEAAGSFLPCLLKSFLRKTGSGV